MAILREEIRGRSIIYTLRCGASLVTEKHLLTAAHCFIDEKTGQNRKENCDLHVILGSSDPVESTDGIERKILDVSKHPEYTYPEAYFDVAIVTLDKNVPKTTISSIRPICLPTQGVKDSGQYFSSSLLNCWCNQFLL